MTQRGRRKGEHKSLIPKDKQAWRARTVAGIRKDVESGKYRVEPKKVADKMVENAIREVRSRGH